MGLKRREEKVVRYEELKAGGIIPERIIQGMPIYFYFILTAIISHQSFYARSNSRVLFVCFLNNAGHYVHDLFKGSKNRNAKIS